MKWAKTKAGLAYARKYRKAHRQEATEYMRTWHKKRKGLQRVRILGVMVKIGG